MKNAFTLLELVFVIVVVGILAATMLPKMEDNAIERAAVQLQSHIRYTQHLAMVDDHYNASDANWFKKRWQIIFSKQENSDDKWAYTIFEDIASTSSGRPNKDEIAINPLNHNQRMTGGYNSANELDINHEDFVGMKDLNLGLRYGVTDMNFTSCSQRIAFDYLGRPIISDLSSNTTAYDNNDLLDNDCKIVISDGVKKATLTIKAQSGYVSISF